MPEIIEELAKQLAEPITIAIVPYPRMVQMQNYGQTDLSVSFQPVTQITTGEHIADIYPLRSVVLIKQEKMAALRSNKGPLAIATLRGALYNDDLTATGRYRLILTNDHEHSIRLVLNARADGVAGPLEQLNFQLDQRLDKSQAFHLAEQIGADKVWLQIGKNAPNYEKKEKIMSMMQLLKEDGTITYIVEKHLAEWGYMYPN